MLNPQKFILETINEGGGARNALPIFATFFQKLYADPAFEDYKNRNFEPVSYDILDLLSCPDFVESLDDYYKKKTMKWFDEMHAKNDSIKVVRVKEAQQRVVDEIKRERAERKRNQN